MRMLGVLYIKLQALHEGAVFEHEHLSAESAGRGAELAHEGHVGSLKADDANRAQTGHIKDRPDGVSAIEGGRHKVAPVIAFAVGDLRQMPSSRCRFRPRIHKTSDIAVG